MDNSFASTLYSSIQSQQEQMSGLSPTTKELLRRALVEIAKDKNTNDLQKARSELSEFVYVISQSEWDSYLKRCLRERLIVLRESELEKEPSVLMDLQISSKRKEEQSILERNAISASRSPLKKFRQFLASNKEGGLKELDRQIQRKSRQEARMTEQISQLGQVIRKKQRQINDLESEKRNLALQVKFAKIDNQVRKKEKPTAGNILNVSDYNEQIQKASKRIIADAQREAVQIIDNAKKIQKEAETIIEETNKRAKRIIENADMEATSIINDAKRRKALIIDDAVIEAEKIRLEAKQVIADAKGESRKGLFWRAS